MGEKLAGTILFVLFILAGVAYSQSPQIIVISPNGGENFEANSVQEVSWKSSSISKIKIEFSWDDGYSWITIEEAFDASSQSYSWKLPDAQSPNFLIRLTDAANPFIYDISDKHFSVFTKSTPTKRKVLEKTTDVPSNSIRIMPLGDSITSGVDKDSTTHLRGPRRTLDSLLNNAGYSFDFVGSLISGFPNDFDRNHEGHGGWVAMPPDPIDPTKHNLGDSLTLWLNSNNPDIILLHIGTNDLSTRTPARIADDVVKLMDTIYNFDPNIKVVLAQIINRAPDGNHIPTANYNIALKSRIDSLADLGRKIYLVDMENDAGLFYIDSPPPAGDFSDALHPNYIGYDSMAVLWFDSLNTILPILQLKIFLQGPYVAAGDTMTTKINSILPSKSPYSEDSITVNYDIPADITDWVLLQLRNTTNGGAVFSKSCFLRKDGAVIDPDGLTTNISLGGNIGNYYVVVKHRNHLAVMSSSLIQLNGLTAYDFTTGSGQFFGTGGAVEVESGIWGMWAGDANGNGIVSYNGASNDKNSILAQVGLTTPNNVIVDYSNNDINLDGSVKYNGSLNDKNKILGSVGLSTPNNSIQTQVP